MTNKFNWKMWIKVALASFSYAVTFELFLIPNQVVVGGVTGIAAILDIFLSNGAWYLSAGVWVVALNIPIFIYCYVKFSKKFATKTLVFVLLMSLFFLTMRLLGIAEIVGNIMGDDISQKIMFTLIGGALSGIGSPLMLSVNGSTGGSDIVGLILQKRSKSSSTDGLRAIFFANILLILLASIVMAIVHDTQGAINLFMYSMAAILVGEIVQERLFKGFSSAIELEITTEKPQEMTDALLNELGHGVTYLKVKGGYSKKDKILILCVINKRQLTQARKIVNKVDSQAFAYVENVREVMGKGFVNKEDQLTEE